MSSRSTELSNAVGEGHRYRPDMASKDRFRPMTRRAPRRVLVLLALVSSAVACGGSEVGDSVFSDDGVDRFAESDSPGADTDAPAVGGDEHGSMIDLNEEAPVTVSVDGVTFGYPIGTCSIQDGFVGVDAMSTMGANRDTFNGGVTLGWYAADETTPDVRRLGNVSATTTGVVPSPGPFTLIAGNRDAGTSWEGVLNGDELVVRARLGDRGTAIRSGDGIEELQDFYDVTIRVRCDQEAFGGAPPREFVPREQLEGLASVGSGLVVIEIDGDTFRFDYLNPCTVLGDEIRASGLSNNAEFDLYSSPSGGFFELVDGEPRVDRRTRTTWGLIDDDFVFGVSGASATWSGTVVSDTGDQTTATVSIECEGEGLVAAGTGSVDVDGITHVLDDVDLCSITGTSVEFYGRAGRDGIVVGTGPGEGDLRWMDEAGDQRLVRGVTFEVSDQVASWTGTLPGPDGPRDATIRIECE